MSRGPGNVQRAIEAAMAARSDDFLTVADLAALAYPGLNRAEKKHRVAAIRAANAACMKTGWSYRRAEVPGGLNIYFNLYEIRSYALALMRSVSGAAAVPDHELRAMYDGRMPAEHFLQSYINGSQPRGAFWYHVEINKADRDGRNSDATTLRAQLDALIAAKFGVVR